MLNIKKIDDKKTTGIKYNGDIMYNLQDAMSIASLLDIKFDKFTLEDFLEGINTELEHGTINPETNITNDNSLLTAKIALAHLNEFPNYYNKIYGIKVYEKFLQSKLYPYKY